MAIDTHIYRVSQRLGFIGPKISADDAHELLEARVPPAEVFNFHIAVINHGRQVCKAQRPRCGDCVVGELCPARKRLLQETAKSAATRPPKPPRRPTQLPHTPEAAN